MNFTASNLLNEVGTFSRSSSFQHTERLNEVDVDLEYDKSELSIENSQVTKKEVENILDESNEDIEFDDYLIEEFED